MRDEVAVWARRHGQLDTPWVQARLGEARAAGVAAGTHEIQLNMVARRVLGVPKS